MDRISQRQNERGVTSMKRGNKESGENDKKKGKKDKTEKMQTIERKRNSPIQIQTRKKDRHWQNFG